MFSIDNQSRQAVYEQIITQVEKYVLSGILAPGDKLPSVRKLSVELNVNPNTVQRAYAELERREVLNTQPGRGAYVSDAGGQLLKENHRNNSLKAFEVSVQELKLAGVAKRQLLSIVETYYKGEIQV